MKASTSALASSISTAILGNRSPSWSRTWSQVDGDGVGVGLGEDGAEHGGDHVLMALGDQGEQVAGEVDAAALVAGSLEAAAQGGDEPGVLIGDHAAGPRSGRAGAGS